MKKIFSTFILLVFLCSCSKTIFVADIVESNEYMSKDSFKYEYSNGYYTCKSKTYSKNKRLLIDSFKSDFENLDAKLLKNGVLNIYETKKLNAAKINLEDSKFCNYDATKTIIVSFNEQLPNLNYKIISVHHWDYSNARFLIPFLTLGNRQHLINQCINRAVQEAGLTGADGVIINANLSSSKLFVLID